MESRHITLSFHQIKALTGCTNFLRRGFVDVELWPLVRDDPEIQLEF
jgi:hypothetical protein